MKQIIKQRINFSNGAFAWYFPTKYSFSRMILIVPNSAGYYTVTKKGVVWSEHLDQFVNDLKAVDDYGIYILVLPGQNYPAEKGIYSWENSVKATIEAIEYITVTNHSVLVGVIGMCTGGAIGVQALASMGLGNLPIVLMNSAVEVGWSEPEIQERFHNRYKQVNLDREALLHAPMPGSIIPRHHGKILQLLGGLSSYPLEGEGGQIALRHYVPRIQQIILKEMRDIPITTEAPYQIIIDSILKFFQENQITL